MTSLLIAAVLFAAPPEPAPSPDDRGHRGFHARGAFGLGAMDVQREGKSSLGSGTRSETSSHGSASALEISLGGGLSRTLVLSGSLLNASLPKAKLRNPDGPDTELDGSLAMWLVGVTADFYPIEDSGLHLLATVGPAVVVGRLPKDNPAQDLGIENVGGSGAGVSLGAGWEKNVSRRLALGVRGRVTWAQVHGESKAEGETFEENDTALAGFVGVSLLFR